MVIANGAACAYLLDLPRKSSTDNSQYDMYRAIKSIKNGDVESVRYGKGNVNALMMEPPHVVVFTNEVPDTFYLTADRWQIYYLRDAESSLQLVMDGKVRTDPDLMKKMTDDKNKACGSRKRKQGSRF